MSLEVAGFVVGAVSLLAAFKGALDTCLLIDSFFDDAKTGCGYLALRYHIQKTRLDLWRQVYNINEPANCPLRHRPAVVQQLVLNILSEITRLFEDTQKLVKRHDIKTAGSVRPEQKEGEVSKTNDDKVKALANIVVKPKSRVMWTIKGKDEFKEKVSRIRELVDDLHEFTTNATESQSLARALPSMSLKNIASVELLQTLQDPTTKADTALTMSARAKLLRKRLEEKASEKSVTLLTNDQIKFLKNSSTLATLRSPAIGFASVWIEWTIINTGTESDEYVRRIKSLGYLLEEAGDSSLRIPICYGIFDDLAYETENGSRRLGYVFGAPRVDHRISIPQQLPLRKYEGNFRDYPPRSLIDLIRDFPAKPIPLLGDRFSLAFTLATAFSNFHSARWLHKGFHSGNIVFLSHESSAAGHGPMISVTDPFITGFQYSRPTTAYSLSRGPLEQSELEHYYHPAADKGFSRRTDLYSLGVVLCEVGRWELVGDTVSERTRRKIVDRRGWRDYMANKVLADIGWRMGEKYQSAVRTLLECRLPDDEDEDEDGSNEGEGVGSFFEQQYFEKVIQPLSVCSA
ncbi:prion-inhibition and propagation-domain-containing protein [Astrocystis sublimbata]|nr:prion-inhibition and propagation-domain-containing protein [Astrocystis sublimbata]